VALLWVSETTFSVLMVGCTPMPRTRWTQMT
jgi:hypothetical protein